MKAVRQGFMSRLNQLRTTIDDMESINELAAIVLPEGWVDPTSERLAEHIESIRTNMKARRVYTYASTVILLYALFEQYVEELVTAYLDELGRTVPRFADLPSKIKKNHTTFSARLLTNLGKDKYRARTDGQEVARRMMSCMGAERFELNSLAFIDHGANFRVSTLNQFMACVGVPGMSKAIRNTPGFIAHLDELYPKDSSERLRDDLVFEELEELVERRNEVAHGWPHETLAPERMKEKIEFIGLVGDSMYDVLRGRLLPYLVDHSSTALPPPIAIYNRRIACFRLESGRLSVGQRVVTRSGTGTLAEGEVVEIQVDGSSLDSISAPPGVDVGCLLNIRAKDTYEYFVLDDPVIAGEAGPELGLYVQI